MFRSILLLAALFVTPLFISGCSTETPDAGDTPAVDSASENTDSSEHDEAGSGTKDDEGSGTN